MKNRGCSEEEVLKEQDTCDTKDPYTGKQNLAVTIFIGSISQINMQILCARNFCCLTHTFLGHDCQNPVDKSSHTLDKQLSNDSNSKVQKVRTPLISRQAYTRSTIVLSWPSAQKPDPSAPCVDVPTATNPDSNPPEAYFFAAPASSFITAARSARRITGKRTYLSALASGHRIFPTHLILPSCYQNLFLPIFMDLMTVPFRAILHTIFLIYQIEEDLTNKDASICFSFGCGPLTGLCLSVPSTNCFRRVLTPLQEVESQ